MKQLKTIKIALDLDGVIWDLVRPWVSIYNDCYKDKVKYEDILEYDLSKSCTKASHSELMNILREKHFWDNVFPFYYSEEYLEKLNNTFDLYIATATNHETAEEKINRFLSLFPFLKREQIICIYNKSLLNVDWLVDDCEANLIGQFNKIILDAPYNRICDKELIRASNLKDVYNILIEYYKE